MRIERRRTERVVKPFKGMSLKQSTLSLTQSTFTYLVYEINYFNSYFSVQAKGFVESVSSSDEGSWGVGGDDEDSSLVLPGIRKRSLRNITPRSYSSLLKSESEEDEEEEQEDKADKSTLKPRVALKHSK